MSALLLRALVVGRRQVSYFCYEYVPSFFRFHGEIVPILSTCPLQPVSRDQILRSERGQGNINFPFSADHEQDWQLYWLIYTLLYGMTIHTYILHTNRGLGKEKRRIFITGPWWCIGNTRYWSYLEDYWPCTGGLSAVNAICTQLHDAVNSGLTRWRMAV